MTGSYVFLGFGMNSTGMCSDGSLPKYTSLSLFVSLSKNSFSSSDSLPTSSPLSFKLLSICCLDVKGALNDALFFEVTFCFAETLWSEFDTSFCLELCVDLVAEDSLELEDEEEDEEVDEDIDADSDSEVCLDSHVADFVVVFEAFVSNFGLKVF